MNFSETSPTKNLTKTYLSPKESLKKSSTNKPNSILKFFLLAAISAVLLLVVINSYSVNKDQLLVLPTSPASELTCNSNANRTGYALGCKAN